MIDSNLKINAEIPDWYQNMPAGSEMVMYARGSAVSADLDNSEQRAIETLLGAAKVFVFPLKSRLRIPDSA